MMPYDAIIVQNVPNNTYIYDSLCFNNTPCKILTRECMLIQLLM